MIKRNYDSKIITMKQRRRRNFCDRIGFDHLLVLRLVSFSLYPYKILLDLAWCGSFTLANRVQYDRDSFCWNYYVDFWTSDNLQSGNMEGRELLAGAARAATYNMALQVKIIFWYLSNQYIKYARNVHFVNP